MTLIEEGQKRSGTHLVRSIRSKATCVASGDHVALPPSASAVAPVPSTFITVMVPPALNRIFRPSGDHFGVLPVTPSGVGAEPSAFITNRPAAAPKTILVPSGDQSPRKASIDGVRSRSSDPSSRTRYKW